MQHEYTAGVVFLLLRIFRKRQRPKCLKPDILIFTEANRHACCQSDLLLPDLEVLCQLTLPQIVVGVPMGCQSQIDAADSIPKEIRFQSLLPHIIAYAAAPIDQEIFPAAAQMDTVSLSHIHKDHIIMRDRAVSEPLQQNSHQQDQQDAAKNRPVLLTQAQKQAGL